MSWMFTDIRSTLIVLFIGYLVYKLCEFYYRVYSLPPGPIPLPIIGNLLEFRGTKQNWSIELERIAKRYGPVMTLWLGNTPRVIISDIDMAIEAFRKNDFAGKPYNVFRDIYIGLKRSDIIFSDYGPTWEVLRRVTHSAVQKYSTTDKMIDSVIDCVDHTVDTMIKRETIGKPFVVFDYVFNLFLNILSSSLFGKRYELDDREYKFLAYSIKGVFRDCNSELPMWDFMPITRKFSKKYRKIKKYSDDFPNFGKSKYQAHYEDYNESVVRDICDSLITSKNEAFKERKDSAIYLTDDNLAMAALDLILAGTETSNTTFRWILFHMLYDKNFERKLRREVETEIGDRMPTHEDKNRCHYVMAFISEALRHSNVIPLALPHHALVDSKLGCYKIPKGTETFVFQGHIMHQSEHWPKPREFIPERFLENGKYLTTKPKAFIPFSVGRRVCLGEKLAIANLFLVLVRFLQRTAKYELSLHLDATDDPLYPDPDNLSIFEVHPKHWLKCTLRVLTGGLHKIHYSNNIA